MRLIGLTGRAGAGKSTVATHLVRAHGFYEVALAEPLRAALMMMFGLSEDDLLDRARKEAVIPWIGVSPRRLMQTLGTEWGRAVCGEDIWLRVAANEIAVHRALTALDPEGGTSQVVVSDIRFPNEAAWLHAQGGVLWHIVRPQELPAYGIEAAHVSERGLPVEDGDVVIDNDNTVPDLIEQVDRMLYGAEAAQ